MDTKALNALGNVRLGEDHILCTINPKIYALETVYSAAYILMDKAYILLDGDPEKEIIVEIRQKKQPKIDLEELAIEFNEQLLNYAVYKVQSERNKGLREIMMQRVMLTNAPAHVLKKFQEDDERSRQEAHQRSLHENAEKKHATNNNAEQEVLQQDSH